MSILPIPKTSAARLTRARRAYYAETLPNPKLQVFPIAEVASIGRPLGIPLIVDNTAAPILAVPSTTAQRSCLFLDQVHRRPRHLDRRRDRRQRHVRLGCPSGTPALLNTPDPSYHGAVWSEAVKPLGPIAYVLKARVTLLRDLGAAISPFNAFLLIQGIETLPLRIERHSENASAVARFSPRATKSRASYTRPSRQGSSGSGRTHTSSVAMAALWASS